MNVKKEKISGERIFLKPLEQKDAHAYSHIGKENIATLSDAKKFIRSSWKKDSYYFGIFLKENDELIGDMELCHMSWWYDKAGEICYFIKNEFRGKGFATEGSKTMVNFCFKKLKLRKVYADTDPHNLASQKVLKKVGFTLEGKIREKNFVNGKWIDEYDFGLLKSEWKQ